MASKLTAIAAYRPRIKKLTPADVKDIAKFVAGRNGMNEGDVQRAILELRDALEFFLTRGAPVKLPGLGSFTPSLNLKGRVKVNLKVDRELLSELNKDAEGFKGTIVNKDNIEKTVDDLVAIWNEEHPDDLVAVTPTP